MADLDPQTNREVALAQVQLDYVAKLGQYKLDTAKAELVEAEAAGQMELARMKREVATRLEQAMAQLAAERQSTLGKIAAATGRSRKLAYSHLGEQQTYETVNLMWMGFRQSLQTGTFDFGTASVPAECLDGNQFVDVRHRARTIDDLPPGAGVSVLAWLGTLSRMWGVMPKLGTKAYTLLVGAFAQLGAAIPAEIEAMKADVAKMQDRTYAAWNPVAFASLPDSAAVRTIAGS